MSVSRAHPAFVRGRPPAAAGECDLLPLAESFGFW